LVIAIFAIREIVGNGLELYTVGWSI